MKTISLDAFTAAWTADPVTCMRREAHRIADEASGTADAWEALNAFLRAFIEVNSDILPPARRESDVAKIRDFMIGDIETRNPPWLAMLDLDFLPPSLDFTDLDFNHAAA